MIHAITPNKGDALVRVDCETDFAARTDTFIAFARRIARLAYAAQAQSIEDIEALFPEVATERMALEKELKEKVAVSGIHVLTLQP